jgi:hypothetical protein
MDGEIQQAVDTLLLEQGVYAPVELLLADGRLSYSDYELWRGGRGGVLESRLHGDPRQCRDLLRQAADYCAILGLEPEDHSYVVWGSETGDGLCFSADAASQRCFNTWYRKSVGHPQLDLFMDATGTTLVNGIVQALCERDTDEARRLLDRLFDVDPENSRLGGLERLVDAAEALAVPPRDPLPALNELRNELVPTAQELLGPGCRHFLVPQWRRLCRALEDYRYDPAWPDRHVSYAAMRAEDWERVRESVESEERWWRQPVLLRRHARACGRLRREAEALGDWFRLCWQFSDQANVIAKEAQPDWARRWREFRDLDPELPQRDFPAWLLIAYPGLAAIVPDPGSLSDVEVPESYVVVLELVRVAAGGVGEALVNCRRKLRACAPVLFAHYMSFCR